MKMAKLFSVMALVMLIAATGWANCLIHPKAGVYQTYDYTLLPGRVSEAWCTPGYQQPGVPGNTENAMSWGPPLGAQWHVWGQAIDAAGPQISKQYWSSPGNGWIEYITNYVGGQAWLSRFHTWGDGVHDLTATLTYYNVTARVTYIGGNVVSVTSNVLFRGIFDDCPDCTLEYVIANASEVWGVDPSEYPPLLCGATAGEFFDACCIRCVIYCPIGTEDSTWGAIKALF